MSADGMGLPICQFCGRDLDRVDHYAIGHYILDRMVYRDLGINDGDTVGGPGIASETELRCGYCANIIDREAAEFFYKRWIRVLEVGGRDG